jgi:hypothetical protein
MRLALVGGLAAFSSPALAKGPQITVTVNIPGVSARPAATATAGASGLPAGPPVNPALLQGQAAWAEAGAYTRYLQYVTLVNSPAGRGMSPQDAAQYFTNGASVMTVPAAGQPGAAYFNNGSELGAPPPAPTAPPAAPFASALPPPPPAPPPTRPSPWWWGDDTTESTDSPPAPKEAATPANAPLGAAAAPAPSPTAHSEEGATPVAALSFEEWLGAMGGPAPDDDGEGEGDAVNPPEPVAPVPSDVPDVQEASLSEPLSAAIEILPRTIFAPREKRERASVPATPSLLGGQAVAVAFGAGLLLGALVMMRLRRREEPLPLTGNPAAPAPAPRSQAL